MEDAGGKALAHVVDIRDEANVAKSIEETVKHFGGIDILINNASAISLTGTEVDTIFEFYGFFTTFFRLYHRVSVQRVKYLSCHFACLCRGFEFYEVKKKFFVIIFQKENGNTFTLLIIFIVKSLQKEQNSTNLLL